MSCDICSFVKTTKNPILETEYWIVFLANDQAYLGRCYVTLKRHCGDLAELNEKEWKDLYNLIQKLESSIKKTFDVTLFNWTCLMNMAYQNKPYDPHVHWHLRPRYDHPVNFEGITFADPEFGKHYAREKERSFEVSKNIQQKIIEEIREHQ